MEKYRYYVIYQHSGGTGKTFITRSTPLDSEQAILEEHEALEQQLGRPVVILDFKRID